MAGPNVTFTGWCDDRQLEREYAGCRALIFPGEEDFGIVPVEAMATGKPVIAYGVGGAAETVLEGETGLFFGEQSVASLTETVTRLTAMEFSPERIRARALEFDRPLFSRRIDAFVRDRWNEWSKSH
jgi:glycosyltransferase involved in cell wall biosynthesis